MRADLHRLAMREPTLIANLLKAGFTEPFPIVANSPADLIGLLTEWMENRPGRQPPASRGFMEELVVNKHEYSMGIRFATTSDTVWAERFQISKSWMVWILKESDNSCMLIKPRPGNSRYQRGYYAWLGGDLGFSTAIIANCDGFIWQDSSSGELMETAPSTEGVKGESQFLRP